MKATRAQRLEAHAKVAIARGLTPDAARAYAYAQEGLPPPVPADPGASVAAELAETRRQLAHERRRADACTRRAQIAQAENEALTATVAKCRDFVQRGVDRWDLKCPLCGDVGMHTLDCPFAPAA